MKGGQKIKFLIWSNFEVFSRYFDALVHISLRSSLLPIYFLFISYLFYDYNNIVPLSQTAVIVD